MAQTKKQQEEVKQAMLESPPKDEKTYLFFLPRTSYKFTFWTTKIKRKSCR